MNSEEEKALKSLERAFKRCKNAGIHFCGMDGDLLYCTNFAFKKARLKNDEAIEKGSYSTLRSGVYPNVAEAQNMDLGRDAGEVNTSLTYEDSGGF